MQHVSRRSFMGLMASAGLGLIGTATPAFASENDSRLPLTQDRIKQSQLLYAAEISSHDIGLASVDFGSVTAGSPVPVYVCKDGGLTLSRIETPLSSGNHIFASYTKEPEGCTQLSLGMGKGLERFVDTYDSHEFALIADANGMNVYDGSRIVHIFDASAEIDNSDLDEIESLPEEVLTASAIRSADVLSGETFDAGEVLSAACSEVNNRENNVHDAPNVIPSDYNYHATYGIDQGNYPICWAASIAFIKNYHHGTNWSAIYDAKQCAPNNWNSFKEGPEIATYLQNKGLGHYQYFDNLPSNTVLCNHIDAIWFIVAIIYQRTSSNNSYVGKHAAVIMGASRSTGLIGLHDSQGGDFFFVTPSDFYYQGHNYPYRYYNPNSVLNNILFSHCRRTY